MSNRDAQIYEDYEKWQAEKDRIGTVDDLAKKWGISRQRFHKIVTLEREKREAEAKSA